MKGLLKFITCGSVDDGKSTLIGHLLYDAKLLYADQQQALELDSKAGSRDGKIDYSLLLDGLMAEREQGITIDVAYRYFNTDNRSFIVADTPGHEQYTRNMAVGASFAELAVILVDASKGIMIQTRRHARICAMMGIRHFIFALNKMDLVGFDEEVYRKLDKEVRKLAIDLELEHVTVIPVSATDGDNITRPSDKTPWYGGETLLSCLENIDVDDRDSEKGFYMPVQRVCRPNLAYRGFQGNVEAGEISVGDEVTVLPGGEKAHIKSILRSGAEAERVCAGDAASLQFDREIDVSRGCVIEKNSELKVSGLFRATLLWMDEVPLVEGQHFYLKLGTKTLPAEIMRIRY
ncbi:MAG: GTP-binding protein, partial [Lachnospiraceae bacterium]|nr:GTP-binding protein [Lachnospiraceae bacterium]